VTAIHNLIAIAVYAQTLSALAFIVEYQRLTKGTWRRRIVGWHLMMMTLADAIFAGQLSASLLWPSLGKDIWFLWLFASDFMFASLIVLSRLIILELAQRRLHPDPDQVIELARRRKERADGQRRR
jgi:hypothetical protein